MLFILSRKSLHFPGLSFLILATAFLLATTGCGEGKKVPIPVSGIVTVDGTPLDHGAITFIPIAGGESVKRAGGGSLKAGRFQVSSYNPNDGLLPGEYQVMVRAIEPISDQAQRWHAPKKYAGIQSSGLTLEVTKDMEEVNFELTWEGSKQSKPFVEQTE